MPATASTACNASRSVPTGVDIRKGSQLGCIQCGLCIDACDAVMVKVHRPTRLIAYDTDENRKRRERGEANVYRLIRPRTILYAAIIALTGCIMLYALLTRTNSHLSVLHVRAPLFTQTAEGGVRNGYTLRFSNKLGEVGDFMLDVSGLKGATLTSAMAKPAADGRLTVRVDPDSTLEVPVYVTTPRIWRRASRRRSRSLRRTRRPESAASWSITSSAHDFRPETKDGGEV